MRLHPEPSRPLGGTPMAAGASARGRGAILRLARDRRGVTAVVTAMALTSLLGMAGLVVEVGNWYVVRRQMQAAADLAAVAGALDLDKRRSAGAAVDAAKSVTSRSGFVHGSGGNTVSAEADPGTGRVTVTVARPETSRLIGAALRAANFSQSAATKTISARAVAQVVPAGATPCVLTLVGSIYVNNNADLIASGCSLASNSAERDAFDLKNGNGKGRLEAAHIVTHGGCEGCVEAMESGKLKLPAGVVPTSYASKTTTAYAYLNDSWSPPASATSNCRAQPEAGKGTKQIQLSPGCYDKIDIKPSEEATMEPGVYYIHDGSFVVKGTLTCPTCTPERGVSIVMVGKNGGTPGQLDISAQATIRLNASRQADPALDGVLIYSHDPNGHQSGNGGGRNDLDFNAGSNVRLDGAVISFTSRLRFTGGAATDANSCTLFVVASMELKGNASLNLAAAGCSLYATKTPTPRIARLMAE